MLDMILPMKDGISILEFLKNSNLDRKLTLTIIMLTAVSNEYITSRALSLGADYLILKPFDFNLLHKRILQIYEHKCSIIFNKIYDKNTVKEFFTEVLHNKVEYNVQENKDSNYENPESYVVKQLIEIGMSPNLKGFNYLKDAIILCIEEPKKINSMTKILYPDVAKIYNTTSASVERAIRHAITITWEKNKGENNHFNLDCLKIYTEKPKNSSFILAIAKEYRNRKSAK